ncbi:hypothetical protein ATKI12_6661 [Kitasatospora sp. Ki12]
MSGLATGAGPPGPLGRAGPVVTGVGVLSAAGRGLTALTAAAVHGKAAFGPVTRFDVTGRRTTRAALLPDAPPDARPDALPADTARLDGPGTALPARTVRRPERRSTRSARPAARPD